MIIGETPRLSSELLVMWFLTMFHLLALKPFLGMICFSKVFGTFFSRISIWFFRASQVCLVFFGWFCDFCGIFGPYCDMAYYVGMMVFWANPRTWSWRMSWTWIDVRTWSTKIWSLETKSEMSSCFDDLQIIGDLYCYFSLLGRCWKKTSVSSGIWKLQDSCEI